MYTYEIPKLTIEKKKMKMYKLKKEGLTSNKQILYYYQAYTLPVSIIFSLASDRMQFKEESLILYTSKLYLDIIRSLTEFQSEQIS